MSLMRTLLSAALCLGVFPACAADLDLIQNATRREGVSLNGPWQTIVDPYESGYLDYRYRPYADGGFGANKKPKIQERTGRVRFRFLRPPQCPRRLEHAAPRAAALRRHHLVQARFRLRHASPATASSSGSAPPTTAPWSSSTAPRSASTSAASRPSSSKSPTRSATRATSSSSRWTTSASRTPSPP